MPAEQYRDDRSTVDSTATIARRPLLRSLAWGGALGAPAVRGLSGRVWAAAGVNVEFERCKVAFVSNASAIESLAVYYADTDGNRRATYEIQPTYTDPHHYRPVIVEYDDDRNGTNIQLTEPQGAIVCVVTDLLSTGRKAHINPWAVCIPDGFNSPPEASFTASVDGTELAGDPIEVDVGEQVKFTSTAKDPDTYDRLRCEWDLDGDGGYEETGTDATETYVETGTTQVCHRVTDDFGEADVACLEIDVVDRVNWGRMEFATPTDLESFTWFGSSVALSDETLILGAEASDYGVNDGFAGAGYLYDLQNDQPLPEKLIADDPDQGDRFGTSVATSGNKVVVGSVQDDDGAMNAGAVFVYDVEDPSSSWMKLIPSDLDSWDRFGYSSAMSGNSLVVGAVPDYNYADGPGSAYAYDLGESSPTAISLAPNGLQHGDAFGSSVAISGSAIAVGAPHHDTGGAVFLFELSGGSPTHTEVVNPGSDDGDRFGSSIALAGETLVIGSSGYQNTGTAYVYDVTELSGQPMKLTPSDVGDGDNFGHSVAISGGTIVVGAPGADDGAGTTSGVAYVSDLGSGLSPSKKLLPDDPSEGDQFGAGVAIAGDMVAVGAPKTDLENAPQAGAAYVFER